MGMQSYLKSITNHTHKIPHRCKHKIKQYSNNKHNNYNGCNKRL